MTTRCPERWLVVVLVAHDPTAVAITRWTKSNFSTTTGESTNGYRSDWPIERCHCVQRDRESQPRLDHRADLDVFARRPGSVAGRTGRLADGETDRRGGRQPRIDVQVVGERLGPVLPGMHRGVLADVGARPVDVGAGRVVLFEGRLVRHPLVAEEGSKRVQVIGVEDEASPVVVADLVAEVAEHGAIRLPELLTDELAMRVIRLGEVEGDDAGVVSGDHVLTARRQQLE